MNGQRTGHKSEKGMVCTPFLTFFMGFFEKITRKGMIQPLMNINKTDLIHCIEQFLKDKQLINSELQKPNTIKKKELEAFLEESAQNKGVEFIKNCEPVKTTYTFSIESDEAEIEFYYRYGNYYTRHSITLK